jgi:hypothetical protein
MATALTPTAIAARSTAAAALVLDALGVAAGTGTSGALALVLYGVQMKLLALTAAAGSTGSGGTTEELAGRATSCALMARLRSCGQVEGTVQQWLSCMQGFYLCTGVL